MLLLNMFCFNSIVYAAKVSHFHFISVLSVVTYLTFSQLYNVGDNMRRVPIIATRSVRFLAFVASAVRLLWH